MANLLALCDHRGAMPRALVFWSPTDALSVDDLHGLDCNGSPQQPYKAADVACAHPAPAETPQRGNVSANDRSRTVGGCEPRTGACGTIVRPAQGLWGCCRGLARSRDLVA